MTSATWKKNEQRQWLSSYWGRYVKRLSVDEMRDLVMWLVWRLSVGMTLAQLSEWREILEQREKVEKANALQ